VRPLLLALLLAGAAGAPPEQSQSPPGSEQNIAEEHRAEQFSLHRAVRALPIAAGLAGLLAFRPRRRGQPPRNPEVVQTQIMLSLVGAIVMLVVGASLARAFGIAGAAGLVRYRAKVSDPKDASVMLSSLGIGLAAGVGLFWLATLATVFVVAVLWSLEYLEPRRTVLFELKVKTPHAGELRSRLETLLRRHRLKHYLRGSSAEEIAYEVEVPAGRPLEPLSNTIMGFDEKEPPAIEWEEKKAK
jgi:hypothetical protein